MAALDNVSAEDRYSLTGMNESKYQLSSDQFESQDDLVDEYDSQVMSAKCITSLTFCERILTFLVVVLLIVVIALAVAFVKASNPAPDYERSCTTPECITASGAILQTMDNTTFPCIDFYQFACGGWTSNTPLPKNKHSWDRFQEVADHTYYTLEKLFEDENRRLHNSAEKKARDFYRSCVISKHQPISTFISQLTQLVTQANGSEPSGEVAKAIQFVHKLGVYPLFSLAVDVDPENTHKNVIKIKGPIFAIHSQYLSSADSNRSKEHIASYRRLMVYSLRTVRRVTSKTEMLKIEADVDDVIRLMIQLARANDVLSTNHNRFSFRKYNISQMELDFPLTSDFSWKAYIKSYWPEGSTPVSAGTITVFSRDALYLQRLKDILSNYTTQDRHKRTVRNYVIWSMMSTIQRYVGPHLFDLFEKEGFSEWKRCIFYTNQAFSLATGAMYLSNTAQQSYVKEVHVLIKYIKEAFKDYLLQKFWMDDATRKLAAEKIDAIIDRVSYGSVLTNNTFLENFYSNLTVEESDWFGNVLSWRRFHVAELLGRLEQRPNRESWLSAPVTVNTFYSPERNDLFFPAAVFQPPFFSPGWPQAMNFGALGSIIGHEITHAFDNLGRQFGKDGKLGDWWGNVTAHGYEVAVPCMRRQYSRYSLRGYSVNGSLTTTENVADNGGLRAALLGYRLWKLTTEERRILPGVNLTGDQLFYISFAQIYCAKYTDDGAFLVTTGDPHSPHPIRVRGTIMNSESFSNVYQCGLNAPMNSRVKCIVW